MSQVKDIQSIILELAAKAEEKPDLDPDIRSLIARAKTTLRTLTVTTELIQDEDGYYSVKDVAELFGVSAQSVYKWIDEGKIEYKEDNSPGKKKRKGYRIPKQQFQGKYAMDDSVLSQIDPIFRARREEEMKEIPQSGFDSSNVKFPEEKGRKAQSYDEIKKMIMEKKKGTQ